MNTLKWAIPLVVVVALLAIALPAAAGYKEPLVVIVRAVDFVVKTLFSIGALVALAWLAASGYPSHYLGIKTPEQILSNLLVVLAVLSAVGAFAFILAALAVGSNNESKNRPNEP